MYHVINNHADIIVGSIPYDHINEYDWLISNIHEVDSLEYQKRYKVFWRMNTARLSDSFCWHYFELLKEALRSDHGVEDVTSTLYRKHTNKGRKSIQFSFATKLLHMANNRLPIYDSRISHFYFFAEPDRAKTAKERINKLNEFYSFLAFEYDRIIAEGLLDIAISKFKDKLQPETFTDHKIIDSLLWAFVSMQPKQGISARLMHYC